MRCDAECILQQVKAEMYYQESKWGTEFDDKNTPNDWASYFLPYISASCTQEIDLRKRCQALIKVAALAVSAIMAQERVGIVPRHYDLGP